MALVLTEELPDSPPAVVYVAVVLLLNDALP
jgi:hypothetical protein